MPIIIDTKGNGTYIAPDGAIDKDQTSLGIIGFNSVGFTEATNENYLFLLENFSNASSPIRPLNGQLWFDSVADALKINTNTPDSPTWFKVRVPFAGPLSGGGPITPADGELWWDNDNAVKKLKVFDSGTSQFFTVGPTASVFTETIADKITTGASVDASGFVDFTITAGETWIFDIMIVVSDGVDAAPRASWSVRLLADRTLASGVVRLLDAPIEQEIGNTFPSGDIELGRTATTALDTAQPNPSAGDGILRINFTDIDHWDTTGNQLDWTIAVRLTKVTV